MITIMTEKLLKEILTLFVLEVAKEHLSKYSNAHDFVTLRLIGKCQKFATVYVSCDILSEIVCYH